MFLDHTNPDSIAKNTRLVAAELRALNRGAWRNGPDGSDDVELDVRLVANSDGELWFATGDVQYDTTHGAACGAVTLVKGLANSDITAMAAELVADVIDQLTELHDSDLGLLSL